MAGTFVRRVAGAAMLDVNTLRRSRPGDALYTQ
jgi:hypothetical protein